MKKKKRKMKIKSLIILLLTLSIAIALIVLCYMLFFTPKVIFKENPAVLEINEPYKNKQFVEKLRGMKWKDIKVEGKINTKKLGTYKLKYKGKGYSYTLECKVKDRKKPIVVTQEQDVSINSKVNPSLFIKSIKDATKTKTTFKKAYKFDKLGDKKIVLIIQDEGGNKTEVNSVAHVIPKDIEAPLLSVHDFEIVKDSEIDFLNNITAVDERDGEVKVSVDTSNCDIHTAGTYTILYSAIDKAGNKAEAKASVHVIEPDSENGKVIYLTIDDGPSKNTPKILAILNRYQIKATFFVTGQFPAYASYIHDEYVQGNAIGLHTYSHRYEQLYASDAAYFQDLANIASLVRQQIGSDTQLIRFPGGTSNTISANYSSGIMSRLSNEVRKRGYQYYDWNGECGDGNSALATSTLIQTAKNYGGVSPLTFLMHDHAGSSSSVEALPAIIEYYKSQGYTFKTLSLATPAYHHNVNN